MQSSTIIKNWIKKHGLEKYFKLVKHNHLFFLYSNQYDINPIKPSTKFVTSKPRKLPAKVIIEYKQDLYNIYGIMNSSTSSSGSSYSRTLIAYHVSKGTQIKKEHLNIYNSRHKMWLSSCYDALDYKNAFIEINDEKSVSRLIYHTMNVLSMRLKSTEHGYIINDFRFKVLMTYLESLNEK